MARDDCNYNLRRADEERARAERAATDQAKALHRQLHDLYLGRVIRLGRGADA